MKNRERQRLNPKTVYKIRFNTNNCDFTVWPMTVQIYR